MGTVSNFRVEPVTVKMQSQETTQVDFLADAAGSLNSKYFKIYTGAGALYYVWFNINSAGVDPAPAGGTGISVAGATNATAATLAAAAVTAIDAIAGFHAKAHPTTSGSIVIMAAAAGATTVSSDGSAATSFTFTQLKAGSDYDLGFTDGAIAIEYDDQVVDVGAHQLGSTIATSIRTGKKINDITVTLKEPSIANIKEVLKKSSTLTTPSGGTATAAWGDDSALQFTQVLGLAEKLVMHPVALSSSDRSRDVAHWLAYLQPVSVNFSGEEPEMIECVFKIYPDYTKTSTAQFQVYGDHLQNWLR